MEILKDIEISTETIDKLNNILTKTEKDEIHSCISFVFGSIRYLRKIGIRDDIIEKLLINDYSLFIMGEETIKNYVEKTGKDMFVYYVNGDYTNIEKFN